jgi:hypothetical protein
MQPQDLGLIATAVFFAIIFGLIWLRRRNEAPLRHEVRAQPVTFRKSVTARGFHQDMNLIVHGDAIEISFAPLRIVFGVEYYFRACEAKVELHHGIRGDWIRITGKTNGKNFEFLITSRYGLREAWEALAGAGAVPIGPPPPSSRQ